MNFVLSCLFLFADSASAADSPELKGKDDGEEKQGE